MKKELREKKDLLLVVVCGVLVFWGMQNLEAIWNLLWEFLGILTPFIMGAFLAFVLNIPLKRAERLLKKNKWLAEHTGITRMLSILMAYAFVLAVVAFVLVLVIPELLDMMEALEVSIPDFVERTERAMQGLERTRPRTAGYFASLNLDWEQIMNTALDVLKNGVIDVVSSTWDIATMVINGAIDLVISLIFSFYILVQKEKLQAQFGKLMYAYIPEKHLNRISRVLILSEQVFSSFVSGQCIEACLFGLWTYLGMTFLGFPSPLTIAVFIGFCTLVPMVGIYIGVGLGALLIMVSAPGETPWFILFMIILTQVDANLIYPRIVGHKVGLPGMWVIVAVFVGGSLFGLMGMLVFVPLGSVLYQLLSADVNKKIATKQAPGIPE